MNKASADLWRYSEGNERKRRSRRHHHVRIHLVVDGGLHVQIIDERYAVWVVTILDTFALASKYVLEKGKRYRWRAKDISIPARLRCVRTGRLSEEIVVYRKVRGEDCVQLPLEPRKEARATIIFS